jgi:hypothetical protein
LILAANSGITSSAIGIIMLLETEIKNGSLVKVFVEFLCKELNILPKQIVIAPYDSDDGTLGVCIDESEDEFIILVKETNRNIGQIFNTVAHEMIHVKQYMKENLGQLMYTCSEIPYMDRWWEQEAYSKSTILLEKFTDLLQQNKN